MFVRDCKCRSSRSELKNLQTRVRKHSQIVCRMASTQSLLLHTVCDKVCKMCMFLYGKIVSTDYMPKLHHRLNISPRIKYFKSSTTLSMNHKSVGTCVRQHTLTPRRRVSQRTEAHHTFKIAFAAIVHTLLLGTEYFGSDITGKACTDRCFCQFGE